MSRIIRSAKGKDATGVVNLMGKRAALKRIGKALSICEPAGGVLKTLLQEIEEDLLRLDRLLILTAALRRGPP